MSVPGWGRHETDRKRLSPIGDSMKRIENTLSPFRDGMKRNENHCPHLRIEWKYHFLRVSARKQFGYSSACN